MLYYNFKNYDEFKRIFGVIEHGNGVKSRRNKVILALWKDKAQLKRYIRATECQSIQAEYSRLFVRLENMCGRDEKNRRRVKEIKDDLFSRLSGVCSVDELDYLRLSDITTLKYELMGCLYDRRFFCGDQGKMTEIRLGNGHMFWSDLYRSDDMCGLCEDGTTNAIRYVNIEKNKTFKMKAGKLFNHIMSENAVLRDMPEQIKRWLSEEFVADWIQYATEQLCDNFELHVNKNFAEIYSSEDCAGYDEDSDSFGSCMVDDDQWRFYRDAVDASAAYLTDDDGMIVARCIIFNHVTDQDGKVWRLAERQYSKGSDLALQRQLVSVLVQGGYIDGYKRVGASCQATNAFLSCDGNSLADRKFSIACDLYNGDTLSYQDSFAWYDEETKQAFNYQADRSFELLNTTSSEFESKFCYSDYHDQYIHPDDAVYDEEREDWFYADDMVDATFLDHNGDFKYEQRCFRDDVVEINGTYYYAGIDAEDYEEYGICLCDCGEFFLKSEGCYSPQYDKYYCSGACFDRNAA